MKEEHGEDHAFLAGVKSALESDVEIDARQLAAIRLAALREQSAQSPGASKTRALPRTVLKVAASVLILAGLSWCLAQTSGRSANASSALQTIAFIGAADADDFMGADAPEFWNGTERLLALQDAPYYEAVANDVDFGDNSDIEF